MTETVDPAAPRLFDTGGAELLTCEEVAKLCRVSDDTVARKLDAVLKPARIGGKRLVYDRAKVLAHVRVSCPETHRGPRAVNP